MLSTYFTDSFTLRHLRAEPAGPHLDDFATELAKSGYCRDRARAYLRGARRYSAWAADGALTVDALDSRGLTAFGRFLDIQCRLRDSRGQYSSTFLGARYFVDFLQVRGVVAAPAARAEPALVSEFYHWMRIHRGVTESTLHGYCPALRRLLAALGETPQCYTARQLRDFVLEHAREPRAPRAKTTITVLRMFLRFLISHGRCEPELLGAIPNIAQWRRASLPSYLSGEAIEQVLATCDGTTALGVRDRAVLLLLARLGLRAGDVAALQFEDIDWENGLFRVSGKNRHQSALPLPQEVGEALLHYTTEHRPLVDDPHVFVTAIAPFAPFSRWMVSTITARALRRANIDTPSYGAHLFRRSAATAMLRQGSSLEAIGAVLRHASIETTHLYTKVDLELLGQVVMPWMEIESC